MKSNVRGRGLTRPTDIEPRFGDALDCRRIYGVRQTKLYELYYEGLIKSVLLRTKGRAKGKRLFDLRSLEAYLASQETVATK